MAEYRIMKDRVEALSKNIADERLRRMFLDCFYCTLKTTTELLGDGTTFVFTGDIPAMWLRDSSVQVMGYLPYAAEDPDVARLIAGLIRRQCFYIGIDPYANAFNREPNGRGHQTDDTEFMSPWLWERKYEVDSLCYPLWLILKYFDATGDRSIFDKRVLDTVKTVMRVFRTEQRHNTASPYRHFREGEHYAYDAAKGPLVGYTGMTWSGYRPSDDACTYGYLVPANQFAVVVLRGFAEIYREVLGDEASGQEAARLAEEIDAGIQKFGVVEYPEFGRIYAYEVDGLGGVNLMDDANVPSLLSLPYLGYANKSDELYRNTRRFILSRANPYFYEGRCASGVGSPHTPRGYAWHIGIIMQLLTSEDCEERRRCFRTLLNTDAGCGVMHEGFDCDDPSKFTREWFAWANTLFAMAVTELLPELSGAEEEYEKIGDMRACATVADERGGLREKAQG